MGFEVNQTLDASFEQTPIEFELDGADVTTNEDTGTPANNRPLPVKLLDTDGNINRLNKFLNIEESGSFTASGQEQQIDTQGAGTVVLEITGTWSGTINFESSIDGTNWDSKQGYLETSASGPTTTGNTRRYCPVSGEKFFRLRTSGSWSGTANYTLQSSSAEYIQRVISVSSGNFPVNAAQAGTWNLNNISGTISLPTGAATEATLDDIKTAVEILDNIVSGSEAQVDIVAALPAGSNTIGNVNQAGTWNITDISGTVSLPTGAATAANQASVLAELDLDVIDTVYIDYSSSNLPGNASNPLELIASSSGDIKQIQVFDSAGYPCELMTGASSSETRLVVFGAGTYGDLKARVSSGTRISVRRLDAAGAISSGTITVNFLG